MTSEAEPQKHLRDTVFFKGLGRFGIDLLEGFLEVSHQDRPLDQIRAVKTSTKDRDRVIVRAFFFPLVEMLVRKIGLNTDELARRLARHAGLRPRDVGYCGLKDRNAVTSQRFSLGLAGREEPDWKTLDSERIQVLDGSLPP